MPARRNTRQPPSSDAYNHDVEATRRPDAGVATQFSDKRGPKSYRYDSSIAPELAWDETRERVLAEWLLGLVEQANKDGEQAVFAVPQQWAGTPAETVASSAEAIARLKSLTQPFLNWAGKAERRQLSVPTIPLFVHERHSTEAILSTLENYKQRGETLNLFGDTAETVADSLDAYEHSGPWANRLVLGDSLQVMNSLLEYEGLGGQVQMIYFDPPYGVKFGSNFQPFVRKREVTHGKDEHMVREPEMVKAYRDTWELGLHSYLSYLRDRLLLAKELLTDSGSIFVQISDENLHHVREVMDEVFGCSNHVVTIAFKKKSSTTPTDPVHDYLLWYSKDSERVKSRRLYFRKRKPEGDKKFNTLIGPDDQMVRVRTLDQNDIEARVQSGWRWARVNYPLVSQDHSERSVPFEFNGRSFSCGANRHWTYDPDTDMRRLAEKGRIFDGGGSSLGGVVFWDDWPYVGLSNLWVDLHGEPKPSYVVQTSYKVIQRCMHLCTDPGDLVFDPTCGSGTTAYVAEQWGRRWITADTSRVPLALARQRLLTATFPWYELKEPQAGPAGGFVYKRKQNRKGEEVGGLVPRITLKSIANDEEPETVTLVDRPEVNKTVTRVAGRFTVEATVQAADSPVLDAAGNDSATDGVQDMHGTYTLDSPRAWLDRMIAVLRQAKTLQLPGNRSLQLEGVSAVDDCEHLHAEAVLQNGDEARIAIAFGPEGGAIDTQTVFDTASEALYRRYDQMFFFGFAMESTARQLVEDRKKLRIPCQFVAMTPDVVMSDLLKTNVHSEIFSLTGLPDIDLRHHPDGDDAWEVELKGLDVFFPDRMETESTAADNLPCWMLDTDYNGRSFCASQVFFPKTGAWDNLQKSLKGRFEDGVWDHLAGTVSERFELGPNRRVAVKVIDERGNELMAVKDAC